MIERGTIQLGSAVELPRLDDMDVADNLQAKSPCSHSCGRQEEQCHQCADDQSRPSIA